MSDIVERLRKLWFAQNPKLTWDDMEAITEEAADEITRLRAENETLRRDVKTAVMGDSAELADVKRENEKLREALEGMIDLAEAANVMNDPAYDAARKVLEAGDE